MDGVQLSQGYRATKRRQFTFYYSQQQKIYFQKLLPELLKVVDGGNEINGKLLYCRVFVCIKKLLWNV